MGLQKHIPAQPAPDHGVQHEKHHAALTLLRVLMRQCRAKARLEPFEACALLQNAPHEGAQPYADALLRVLVQGLSHGPVIHRVGAPERSFDESWLLALMDAISRDDRASTAFLLRARLPLHLRRHVGWLAAQMMQRLAGPKPD
ncbi:hypothetical protein [Roseinatronobacter sp. NSM]|uniref:hypothetical protein n=1 Tax=Roseinatronobacter sp. NSM TaxID=3457785 RepID=UPI00403741E7